MLDAVAQKHAADVLRTLSRSPDLCFIEVVQEIGGSHQTVRDRLDALERVGLVDSERGEARNDPHRYWLTREGERVAQIVDKILDLGDAQEASAR